MVVLEIIRDVGFPHVGEFLCGPTSKISGLYHRFLLLFECILPVGAVLQYFHMPHFSCIMQTATRLYDSGSAFWWVQEIAATAIKTPVLKKKLRYTICFHPHVNCMQYVELVLFLAVYFWYVYDILYVMETWYLFRGALLLWTDGGFKSF